MSEDKPVISDIGIETNTNVSMSFDDHVARLWPYKIAGGPPALNAASWIEQVLLPYLDGTHILTNSQDGDYSGSDSKEYTLKMADIKQFILSRKDEWKDSEHVQNDTKLNIPPARDGREVDDVKQDIELAEKQLKEMCETGARNWTLRIPAQNDDPDLVYSRIIQYAKQLLATLPTAAGAKDERYKRGYDDGYDAATAAGADKEDGWLPIESAPKGKDFLACSPGVRPERCYIDRLTNKLCIKHCTFHTPDFTLWMPLPTPPAKGTL